MKESELSELFRGYEALASKADQAFEKVAEDYPECVRCSVHCDDCCYAVFGVFLIEAAYLQYHFSGLPNGYKSEAILRCSRADQELDAIQRRLQETQGASEGGHELLSSERVRCPLLNEDRECILYNHRPITCRVYGIPVKVEGKARVCHLAGFEPGGTYPAFDLDGFYRDLYDMSKELVEKAGGEDPSRAGLLISVSKAITSPLEALIHEPLETPGRG
ncbi:MAG: hypothetical protein ACLFUP_06665 [Desulfobacteraceae bacterium]